MFYWVIVWIKKDKIIDFISAELHLVDITGAVL